MWLSFKESEIGKAIGVSGTTIVMTKTADSLDQKKREEIEERRHSEIIQAHKEMVETQKNIKETLDTNNTLKQKELDNQAEHIEKSVKHYEWWQNSTLVEKIVKILTGSD